MDFIFMLTRQDRTVVDCLDIIEEIAPLNLQHIGFKDIGVEPDVLEELHAGIKAAGATSYLEVVSTTPEAALTSAETAARLGVDVLLGGIWVEQTLRALEGTNVAYLPFVGRPEGHPTRLGGDAAMVADQCRRFEQEGCAGVDLLAYRAYEAPPLALVAAARRALTGRLVVAGSIERSDQIHGLADLGADGFTVGSAAFAGAIAPAAGGLRRQLEAIDTMLRDPASSDHDNQIRTA